MPLQVVQALSPNQQFVVIETNQHNGGMFCTDRNGNGRLDDGIDICIGDPASHNAHRGWLNLNYIYNTQHLRQADPNYRTFEQNVPNRGCGPNPNTSTDDGLQGWASGDCPYPFPIFAGNVGYTNGDFIHGDPGARQSSLMEIENYAGQIAYVPVFDYIYMSDYMAANFPAPEGIGWPRAGGGGHAFLYHIVGFTAVPGRGCSGAHAGRRVPGSPDRRGGHPARLWGWLWSLPAIGGSGRHALALIPGERENRFCVGAPPPTQNRFRTGIRPGE